MRPRLEVRNEVARLAHENAGREITQNFDTMNSNVTLGAGTLAAVLTVLGAGELFGEGRAPGAIPALSGVSLVVLAVAAPMIMRFQIRSTIAYQQLIRFRNVQDSAWRYLTGRISWRAFDLHVDAYVTKWKSPEPLGHLWFHNAKYGFAWVDLVTLCALIWAFVSTQGVAPRLVAASALLVAGIWEGWTLLVHDRTKYFTMPDERLLEELQEALHEPPNGSAPSVAPSPKLSPHET